MLSKLQKTIDFVWDNEYSGMYRDLWGERGITKKPLLKKTSDWDTLPFLTKDFLQKYPNPTDRYFKKLLGNELLLSTSGTSGQGPLHVWRDVVEDSIDNLAHHYHSFGAKRIMTFMSHQNVLLSAKKSELEITQGDTHDLLRSSRLAKTLEVDSLMTTVTVSLVFADYLKKIGYSDAITSIFFYGEHCSPGTLRVLKQKFPKARFLFQYALTESCGIVAQASSDCSDGERFFHVREDVFFTEKISEELVITTLVMPHSMPLIRYKTGDAIRYNDHNQCLCGSTSITFEHLGRLDGDFVRVGGGEIRRDEVDRVMSQFFDFIEPTFKIEIAENANTSRRVHITIRATKREGCAIAEDVLRGQILRILPKDLRLSPTMRLGDAITAKLFEVPTIIFTDVQGTNIKTKRLILT